MDSHVNMAKGSMRGYRGRLRCDSLMISFKGQFSVNTLWLALTICKVLVNFNRQEDRRASGGHRISAQEARAASSSVQTQKWVLIHRHRADWTQLSASSGAWLLSLPPEHTLPIPARPDYVRIYTYGTYNYGPPQHTGNHIYMA